MKIGKLVFILMPLSIVMAFLWAPSAQILGDASRIIYFHVPLAWVSVLAFTVSGIASVVYLFDKEKKFYCLDEKAYNSAGIGMVFTVLTIITGSIWAKISWGSYWNWDPRETSIVILFLIYIAYFSLYSALENNDSRGRIISAYLIFAMITVPFFIFIVPRIYPSLHPDPIINPEKKLHLDGKMRITLLVSTFSFTFLYFYILDMKNRILILMQRIDKKYEEDSSN